MKNPIRILAVLAVLGLGAYYVDWALHLHLDMPPELSQ